MAEEDEAEEAETVNAADPKTAERARVRKRRADEAGAAFWKAVFADPAGRTEMWALLQAAHAFEERFACGPTGFPQPEATWFHAGEQAFGLRLYQSWLRIDGAAVLKMHEEHDPRFQKPRRR